MEKFKKYVRYKLKDQLNYQDKSQNSYAFIYSNYMSPISKPSKKYFNRSNEKNAQDKGKVQYYNCFIKNNKSQVSSNNPGEKSNIIGPDKKPETNKKNVLGGFLGKIIMSVENDNLNNNNSIITINKVKPNTMDKRGNAIVNIVTVNIGGKNNWFTERIKELETMVTNLKNEVNNIQTKYNQLLQENNYYKNEFAKLNINKPYPKNTNNYLKENKNIKVENTPVKQVVNKPKENALFNKYFNKNLNSDVKTGTNEANNNSNLNNNTNINNNNGGSYISVVKKFGVVNNNIDNGRKEQKMTDAMKRIKRQAKSVDIEKREDIPIPEKSDKIFSFAKLLEVQLNKNGGNFNNIENNKNNNIVKQNDDVMDMIENKPIENKKKKRKNLSFDG